MEHDWVVKPWGRFKVLFENKDVTVKIIEVNPGECLSLQSHRFREEMWTTCDEHAIIQQEETYSFPSAKKTFFIPIGMKHRLFARVAMTRIVEVSYGKFDENDIIRYEDKYSRV